MNMSVPKLCMFIIIIQVYYCVFIISDIISNMSCTCIHNSKIHVYYTCILLLKYEACIHGRFEPARYNFKLGKHASTYT